MTKRPILLLGICWLVLALCACSKEPTAPAPLALEQVPLELAKAFSQPSGETKDLVARIREAIEKRDYPDAYTAVQSLCNVPNQTSQQQALSVRAMLSIHSALQNAGAQGDEKATAALNYYHSTK